MNQFLAAFGDNINTIGAAFGTGFEEVMGLISAFRAGHLDENGNDLYAFVVNMMLEAYPTELVDLMKAASSDDVLERLRIAYNNGRSVVDGAELRAVKAAVEAQDMVEVQRLMTILKGQFGSAMADVGAAFGNGFSEVVTLIEAWRMDHLEDGDDLYAIVIEMMIESYSAIHDNLKQIAGNDVLDRIRSAYAAGRSVVSGDDLRALKAALEAQEMATVQTLMNQFFGAFAENMDAVAQRFGAGFEEVICFIQAYRAGHVIGGVDLLAQVIDQLIASYPQDLVDQLKAAVGDDVMTRLRAAYFNARSVVDANELQQLAVAITDNDLQTQHTIITALKAEFADNIDLVKEAFGVDDFNTMESMIIAYRTGGNP